MIPVRAACFLLSAVGAACLLGLTPERVAEDLTGLASRRRSLRAGALEARGRRRPGPLTAALADLRAGLTAAGRGGRFAGVCASSLLLLPVGGLAALALGNAFLVPVLAAACALLPFALARRTVSCYKRRIQEDLEIALSLTTAAYLRTNDVITAAQETAPNLRPPIRGIFEDFIVESTMISSDVKRALRRLRSRVGNSAAERWCDALILCRDDRALKQSLLSEVEALSDIRRANLEIRAALRSARAEYLSMAGLLLANIPLLYALNRDWYGALLYTAAGKAVLAVCAAAVLVTTILMFRYTKPIEYRR